mmetsp:Transcript_93132/g.267949  ORF Transcript_93132/g.267949 Transcript_93132/m.267949 type:complete len:212 (+) Transcript_93132:744-1379(+)
MIWSCLPSALSDLESKNFTVPSLEAVQIVEEDPRNVAEWITLRCARSALCRGSGRSMSWMHMHPTLEPEAMVVPSSDKPQQYTGVVWPRYDSFSAQSSMLTNRRQELPRPSRHATRCRILGIAPMLYNAALPATWNRFTGRARAPTSDNDQTAMSPSMLPEMSSSSESHATFSTDSLWPSYRRAGCTAGGTLKALEKPGSCSTASLYSKNR